jgi:L-seryl-tRNA(Ser) seleniumtransferase
LLQKLPSVDEMLGLAEVQALMNSQPRRVVVEGVRRAIAEKRQLLLAGVSEDPQVSPKGVARCMAEWIQPALIRVINATGIMLHTNLGRAPLSRLAIDRVAEIAGGYCNLEMDLSTGKRGSRMDAVKEILCELSSAPAALVLNNNAAAVYLILRVLAKGRSVVVSRGELVEIGGSFRIPDVMSASQAILCEVGCTNRTRVEDYEQALGPHTAMILVVHRSNFEVVGFTEQASLEQLSALADRYRLPLVVDMGSATLLDNPLALLRDHGVAKVLAKGVDLVCFSGDKLLGGPQAGIVLGSEQMMARLASDPMARALRVDKMVLAALEASLAAYRSGGDEVRAIPINAMLLVDDATLRKRAGKLRTLLSKQRNCWDTEVVRTQAQVGGGSLPLVDFPSFAVAVKPRAMKLGCLAARLRLGRPSVLGRLENERLLLDVRTLVDDRQVFDIADAMALAGGLEATC